MTRNQLTLLQQLKCLHGGSAEDFMFKATMMPAFKSLEKMGYVTITKTGRSEITNSDIFVIALTAAGEQVAA